MTVTTSAMEKQEKFLASPFFAVVGVSNDESKWASKVLKWYKDRHLPVTPVHAREKEIQGMRTVRSISDLPNPSQTSISIITAPYVTLSILKQAKGLNVPAIWLQPGSEDELVIKYITENSLSDRVLYGGPCILKEGPRIVDQQLFEETYKHWAM